MQANMGTADRVVRLIAGVAVIGAGIYFGSWWGAIGLVLIATALMKFCPAYMPFGIRTCGGKEKDA
jgi:hypothetical protein